MKRATSLLFAAAFAGLLGLAACTPPVSPFPPGGGGSASCQGGRTRLSAQSWWQHAASDGTTVFPQSLGPGNVGGHLHVETCFPVNQRVDGTVHFDVMVMGHQGFTAHGSHLNIGLAPGGDTVADVPAPDMACGRKPAKCHAMVGIDLDTNRLPSGLQSLRFRYLKTEHPNGERQYASTEWPIWVRTNPGGPARVTAKGWYTGTEYAQAGLGGDVPRRTLSGNATFDLYSKTTNTARGVTAAVDARFGDDDPGTTVGRFAGQYRGPVTVDTRRFTNGTHCFSVRVEVDRGDGGVNTGVFEVPIQINNPGRPSGNGRGSCFAS